MGGNCHYMLLPKSENSKHQKYTFVAVLIKTLEHIVIMSNSIHYVALFRLESLSNFEVLDQIERLNKVVALQGPQFLHDKIL